MYLSLEGQALLAIISFLFLKENPNLAVINLDKLTFTGNKNYLIELENNNRYKYIKGDICDAFLVQDIFENNAIKKWLWEYLLQL